MPRRDAQRNRELLLESARDAFAGHTGPSPVSLEAVARAAGLGIGTLYRHFPTREALVEEVYRTELAAVCASAAPLLERMRPDRALRVWMDRYGDFVQAKRGMAETLRVLLNAGLAGAGETRQRVRATVALLLDRGADAGLLRDDIAADDVVVSLIGVFLATAEASDRDQAGRMLDLLVDGLRSH
ncbi:TetR/AcrR family transcriptional regulator [Frondihabitans sp. PAMC 28766]|uniref:TetR/AcrR family transcriptional regulator n=1 Tax=Frondihabitans sp. PAMC 28766 TaxID=1795630 RepID=UPI001EF4950D|nr:TetR family transcriptional regulator [Frondihabitans sp. PAMC 28766]